jgi:hypothetical protein
MCSKKKFLEDVENIRNMCSEKLNIFVKLFSLLYADDTIILSETEADMQYALAIFEKYCVVNLLESIYFSIFYVNNIKLCELDPSI